MITRKKARVARAAATDENTAQAHSIDSASNPVVDLDDPGLYINRELSLLAFQRRVLEEAQDESNPLLERVKFLSIFGSNLDEFFMIRVAGLMQQGEGASEEFGLASRSAAAQIEAIRLEVNKLFAEAYAILRNQLVPALTKEGIKIVAHQNLTEAQRAAMESYFLQTVFPVLTPL